MAGGVSRPGTSGGTEPRNLRGGRGRMWILCPEDAGSHPTVVGSHPTFANPAPRFGRMRATLSRVNEAKPAAEFETSHKRNIVSQSSNLIYVPRPVRVKTAARCRSLDRHLHASGRFQVQRPWGGGGLAVRSAVPHAQRSPARAARSRTRVSPGRPLLERSSTGAPVPRDASPRRARSEPARAPVPSENGSRPAARRRGSSRLSRVLPRRG